jgi:hypothetical protein
MSYFSYSKSIQKEVPKSIFDLGIKLYLEGKILNYSKLSLENWRDYKVLDMDVYFVRMPIIHFLLPKSDYQKTSEVLNQFVVCQCLYFKDFGLCKHVVAVCHSLEKEFFEVDKGQSKVQKPMDLSILDNVFVVEQKSKQTKLSASLDTYFAQSNLNNTFWWEQFIFDYQKNYLDYGEFQTSLPKYFDSKLVDFDNEKKVFNLAIISLRLDGIRWWKFWCELLPSFGSKNQLKFWSEVWKMRFAVLTRLYDNLINSTVRNLPDESKGQILEQLKLDFENKSEIWLDFVISSIYRSFLSKNLDYFDPETLIDICYLLPEDREQIETRILDKIRVWSDFLPVGEYYELQRLLTKWKTLGYSDYLDEAIKYITVQHKKKPKLMSFIRDLKK